MGSGSSPSRAPTRAQASPSAPGTSRKAWRQLRAVGERERARPARQRARHQAIRSQSFHIHALNLALALATDIEKRGGRMHEHSEAVGLSTRGGLAPAHAGRRSPRAMSCSRATPISARCSRGLRAVLPVATYVAVTAKIGPGSRSHPLARRDLRHPPRRRLLSRRRWRRLLWVDASPPTPASRPGCARDAGRHACGLSPARRHRDRVCLARHQGYASHACPRSARSNPACGCARRSAATGWRSGGRGRCRGRRHPGEDDRWRLPRLRHRWAGGPLAVS
jgi:hypothetical protein